MITDNIQRLTDARGWRAIDLAYAARVSEATANNWLSGRFQPRADQLVPLADALGVTVDALLRDSDEVTADA